MEEEFWQYSKNIYAKSSKSFLWLQDERSLDVNLLLFCYWLGEKGKRLTVDDISRCCKNVEFAESNRKQCEIVLSSAYRATGVCDSRGSLVKLAYEVSGVVPWQDRGTSAISAV